MARTKKEDTGELMISIEQFTRTRDSVIVSLSNVQRGLAHVQNGLNDLMNAYIKHTASVLAGEDGALESLQLPENVADTANAAMAAATFAVNNAAQAVAVPATAAADTGKTKKRKREKKEKDPNAPKRPLTAAFLYAQAARPVVKKDLESELAAGQKLEPNAVNFEVNKRWNDMPEEEKEQWKASYRESMKKFQEDLAAYQAAKGAAVPVLHPEEEVSDEAEVGALDTDADSDTDEEAAVAPSPLVVKAPTPPTTNGKTPRANKRQKTAQTNGTADSATTAAAGSAQTPVPLPGAAGRQVTLVQPPKVGAPAPAPTSAKEKKDSKKRKEKAAPLAIAPAPAAKEASPEEAKKKTKSSRTTRNTEADGDAEKKEEPKPATKKRDRSKRKSEATT